MFDHFTAISAVRSTTMFIDQPYESVQWLNEPAAPVELLPQGLIEDQI